MNDPVTNSSVTTGTRPTETRTTEPGPTGASPPTTPVGPTRRPSRDAGTVLTMVLVTGLVMGAVVAAVASYTVTTLRYGQIVESRANRLAAAQGAMDDAIEQLSIRSSVCSTQAGAGGGVTTVFPEQVNGTTTTVNCRIDVTSLPSGDFFALGITGLGAPADNTPTFRFTLGGRPEIGGPVYVHSPTRASFSQTTTINEGDLWFTDHACAAPDLFRRSSMTLPNLRFEPNVRGLNCIAANWEQLAGPTPTVPGLDHLPTNPPHSTDGSCRVFEPGIYTSPPDLGSSNYFRNGLYHFVDLGEIVLHGRTVTFGHRSIEGFPVITNSACNNVRLNDGGDGATLYTSGSTRFRSRANSGLEVSGRELPGAQRSIGVQVLGEGPGYHAPILSSDNGAQKELAVWGQLWAPRSSVVFGTVPAQKAAALRGGAWIARLDGGVSAAAIGFVIEVPTESAPTKLILESTATDDRGDSTVRVVADYRPTTGEVAVNSRRIVD